MRIARIIVMKCAIGTKNGNARAIVRDVPTAAPITASIGVTVLITDRIWAATGRVRITGPMALRVEAEATDPIRITALMRAITARYC